MKKSRGVHSVIPGNSHTVNANPRIDISMLLCVLFSFRTSNLVSFYKKQNPTTGLQGLRLIVEPEGVEPSSKRATKMLSTYLVFNWF